MHEFKVGMVEAPLTYLAQRLVDPNRSPFFPLASSSLRLHAGPYAGKDSQVSLFSERTHLGECLRAEQHCSVLSWRTLLKQ